MVEQCAQDMSSLITGLLSLASLTGQDLARLDLDLSGLALTVAARLSATEPARQVDWVIEPGLSARGDEALLSSVLQNLMDNAWKYCPGHRTGPHRVQ